MPKYKKLLVVGDGGSGKTTLLLVFAKNHCPEEYVPTVFQNHVAAIEVNRKNYELILWDTAGQEGCDRIRPLTYPGTDVFVVCFAVDSPSSLENITKKWIPEINRYCPSVPIVLVANKIDLRNNANSVTAEQGKAAACLINAAAYLECSAKSNEGVAEVFQTAVKATLKKRCVLQ